MYFFFSSLLKLCVSSLFRTKSFFSDRKVHSALNARTFSASNHSCLHSFGAAEVLTTMLMGGICAQEGENVLFESIDH
jgi:hypothetical protein